MNDRVTITFVVQGDDGPKLAASLDRALEVWRVAPALRVEDPTPTGRFVLHVVITDPQRETSVEHGVSYARSEIEAGIGAAGGSIWDGTHVQIKRGSGSA